MITVESQLTGNDELYNKQYWDNQITMWKKKIGSISHKKKKSDLDEKDKYCMISLTCGM